MRILEISTTQRAAFAGMMLAEAGAEVVRIEARECDPLRSGTGDKSAFDFVSRRKKSITLDLECPESEGILNRLIETADALVEDRGDLDCEDLRRIKPAFVLCSILPYGNSGPQRDWVSTELTMQAAGGLLYGTGWRDKAPVKLPGHTADHIAGLNGATAILAALYSGEGAHLDVSVQESVIQHLTRHIAQWSHTGTGTARYVRDIKGIASPIPVMAADGWLYSLALRVGWQEQAAFFGLNEFAGEEWADYARRVDAWDDIEPQLEAAVASRSKYEWFADAASRGYTFAPVDDAAEILKSPHLRERGFFEEAQIDGETCEVPGLPFTFEGGDAGANRAPGPGEHNALVYGEWLGMTDEEIGRLTDASVI